MTRTIKKVAVLGSGIMGSRIACHFANIGVQVLLLDIVPKELLPAEKAKGLTLQSKPVRNRLVNEALKSTLKSKPSPIYSTDFIQRIDTGNFEDNLGQVAEADWIIEVVVERLDIKQQVFEQVEKHRKIGSLISSNTSGIPINLMTEGRSEDFKKHFCGTHFFNPPRYLELLEIIPTKSTLPSVVDFLMHFGDRFLGKTTVLAKDTPAFIANRVGIFGIMDLFHNAQQLGLSITDVDKLTGPIIGRPKSATFRTADVVGLDTLMHVSEGLHQAVKNDERNTTFALPEFLQTMKANNWLGSKTGQGFYKKVKGENGKSQILALDLKTLEYGAQVKTKFPVFEQTKTIDKVIDRFKVLVAAKGAAGDFYRKSFAGLFAYASNRIPEISDELFRIDQGMRAGFGWQHGPFQIWDAIGIEKGLQLLEDEGLKAGSWVGDMLKDDQSSFYNMSEGVLQYYSIPDKEMRAVPGSEDFIVLDNIRAEKTIWKNTECSVLDLGEGILCVEFQSKMNSLGSGVLAGINEGIELAEKEYKGVVIANQGENFTVGANLAMIFMMAIEQEYDDLNFAVKYFQDTMMRIRYSDIPVVVAPHSMTLGGGCEAALHADAVQAAAETYMGLVEFGVGVIPGGGGSKEMTKRASDRYVKDDVELNAYRENLINIAQAKVSSSAYEAFELGYLVEGRDKISMNKHRLIADAKASCLSMANRGYKPPTKEKNIKVLGKQALGTFMVGAHQMWEGGYATAYEKMMVGRLGEVFAGGDLSEATQVSEQYLLDMERKVFVELCAQKSTMERIQHMLQTGKPLRN